MKITSKSRYALGTMIGIALNPDKISPRLSLAAEMNIPPSYIDHILALLCKADLLKSHKGRYGGFSLNKSTSQISLWDIFSAVESDLYSLKCIEKKPCPNSDFCLQHIIWVDIYESFVPSLKRKMLDTIVNDWLVKNSLFDTNKNQVPFNNKCKAPIRIVVAHKSLANIVDLL